MNVETPIWVLMKITEKEIERRLNDKAQDMGLTSSQMQAMHFICRKSGQICQKDMEERFDLTHATVSGIITRLEAKRFIETRPDDADKRRKVIYATEKAFACNDEIHAYIVNSDPQLMNGFSDEEKLLMRKLLWRMLDNLNVTLWTNEDDIAAALPSAEEE